MSLTLPARASLDWLRKTARQRLPLLRADRPEARLADAQRDVARDYGFSSWRALKAHIDSRRPSEEAVAAFLRAVGQGDLDAARAALADDPALIDAVGPHPFWGGRPQALHVAIESRRRPMFDLILASGADVDGDNDGYDGWSPLMLTFTRDAEDMRRALLERGARIGLAEALLMKDDERVAALLRRDRKALPTRGPNRGSIMAFARTPFAIDRLLELGVDATAKDRWGASPIEAMSRLADGGQDLVRHLMLRGVAAEPQEFARLGEQEALARLIQADPSILRRDVVLMGAVDFGRHDLARWLLEKGADPNARAAAQSRHTALHSAAWNGDLEMVRLLVAAGADPAALDEEHHGTPQGWAEVSTTVTNNPKCAEVAAWLAGLQPA